MENMKPWQIVLFIAAAAVVVFSIQRMLTKSKIGMPSSVLVVDVETGDVYKMLLGKRNGAYFPERHPDTDRLTLMPIEQSEDGEWSIIPHAFSALQDVDGEINVVDEATGRVSIESEKVLKTLKAGG